MNATEYKERRKLLGTQKHVAGLLGVSRETIARRESKNQEIEREAELAIMSLPVPASQKDNAQVSAAVVA